MKQAGQVVLFRFRKPIWKKESSEGTILLGATGHIAPDRLERIKRRLAEWIARPWRQGNVKANGVACQLGGVVLYPG